MCATGSIAVEGKIPVANGVKITNRDLVREYVRLSETAGPFAQVPHGRYINFVSDFMAAEQSGHKRAGDQGLDNVEGAGCAEGLSIVEEVPVFESEAIVTSARFHYPSRWILYTPKV